MSVLLSLLVAAAGQVHVDAGDSVHEPIALVGWNADVVFENAAVPQAAPFDWSGPTPPGFPVRAWFEAGLQGHADGLPVSRRFTSQAKTNTLFELQSYNTNNVLLLMERSWGTLVLTRPAAYRSLSILAAAAGGPNSGTVQIGYRDGNITKSSAKIPFRVPDWWASYPGPVPTGAAPAITGLGRSAGSFKYEDWKKNQGDAGFALYQTDIDVASLNLEQKAIQSLTFTKGGDSVTLGIFAVSGELSKPPGPAALESERR